MYDKHRMPLKKSIKVESKVHIFFKQRSDAGSITQIILTEKEKGSS